MQFLFFITLLSLVNSTIAAESSIRPGLWEITTTSDLLNFASKIPPDQMKNLDALAKEYGFDMPIIQNGAAKSNTCITPEMANQEVMPDALQAPAGCVVKKITQNGSNYHADFVCDNLQVKGNGAADGTLTSKESFTARTVFNGTVQGTPVSETADIIGKWANTSCGSTKP
ncbi:MAG: DUF3617 domain-containing protein [Methylotenera sp.]|nr:DUF3617 domain-containing protein [Methylotenera sp.]